MTHGCEYQSNLYISQAPHLVNRFNQQIRSDISVRLSYLYNYFLKTISQHNTTPSETK